MQQALLVYVFARRGLQALPRSALVSRHHLVDAQTWSGPTRRLPDGRKRRRKITHFKHFKRRSYSQAGWNRARNDVLGRSLGRPGAAGRNGLISLHDCGAQAFTAP
jgi:hypothetical protein